MTPEEELHDDLRDAVRAARRPDVYAAVREIYASLDAEVAARRPRCDASGKCCDFDAYGHRLYVTTAELATFLTDLAAAPTLATPPTGRVTLPQAAAGGRQGGCVFQLDRLCSVHAFRPFGCRIYYCDPTATDWMQDAYERYHARLRDLHQRLGLEYRYVEWRQALAGLLATAG